MRRRSASDGTARSSEGLRRADARSDGAVARRGGQRYARQRAGRSLRRRGRSAAAPHAPKRSTRSSTSSTPRSAASSKDDRAFVVDCLDYRKGKDAELKQMARFMMEKAKTTRHAAGDGTAQPLCAPARAPHRCRGSADVVGEHRRCLPEDGDHFLPEVSCGGWNRHCRSGRDVQHDRHHRRHRHAARPWRARGRSHERAERCDDRAGADGTARAIRVRAMPHSPASTVPVIRSTASSSPSSPRRIRTPARTSRRSARTAARCCCGPSSAKRCATVRGSRSRASSRCARISTGGSISCRPKPCAIWSTPSRRCRRVRPSISSKAR